jgi:ribosome-associated translation inhibitor RaiA
MESEVFIQIHADNQIESDNERDSRLEEQIRQRLARFEDRITDVEVHVSDINGPRGGNADLRCSIEARVNGIAPVAAIDQGDTVDRAVIGAAKKVVRALDHQLGRLNDRSRGR